MQRILESWGNLVHVWRDVADLIDLTWSDLSNVHVNHVRVEAVDIEHLILVVAVNVDGVLHVEVFVGQDHVWMAVLVARSTHVVNFQISVLL